MSLEQQATPTPAVAAAMIGSPNFACGEIDRHLLTVPAARHTMSPAQQATPMPAVVAAMMGSPNFAFGEIDRCPADCPR